MKKLRGETKQESIIDGNARYCNVAAAVIGSAVIGGAVSASSSRSAAKTQASAARDAADTQSNAGRYATDAQTSMFNTINGQQQPMRDAGNTAIKSLSSGTQDGTFNNSVSPIQSSQTLAAPNAFQYDKFKFDNSDLKANLAPNYDFMLKQGMGALNNQASVGGGLVSGNALKGINDYAQNYAQNGYQNAFNNAMQTQGTNYNQALSANQNNYNQNLSTEQANYNQQFQNQQQSFNNVNTNQSNIFNRLASIAGIGQTANGQSAVAGVSTAGNIGNIATTTAGNVGSAQLAGGAASAAGIRGVGNSISNGLNDAAGWYMSSQQPASYGSAYTRNDIANANNSSDPIESIINLNK